MGIGHSGSLRRIRQEAYQSMGLFPINFLSLPLSRLVCH